MILKNHTGKKIPHHLGNFRGMGPVLGVFRVKALYSWISAIVGLLIVSSALLGLISSGLEIILNIARYGPLMAGNSIFFLPLAILLFFIGLAFAVRGISNLNKWVVIYDRGLVFSNGDNLIFWFWQDVELLYSAITSISFFGLFPATTYSYTLRKINGSSLRLNNEFEKIAVIGEFISQNVPPQQYRRLIQMLEAGKTVTLGDLLISRQAVSIKNQQFYWKEIESLNIKDGYLRIKKTGQGKSSSVKAQISSIPNVEAFYNLAARMINRN